VWLLEDCAAPGERQYSVASSFGLRQGGGRFAAASEDQHDLLSIRKSLDIRQMFAYNAST
jgi:hypothetical protein